MFAASNGHIIQVFNFYTGENLANMQFKAHTGKVRSITWAEDDLGFVSAAMDGTVYEWRFYTDHSYVKEFY
jgi:WD40 repeat protein